MIIPTPEEILSAIPLDGIWSSDLLKKFLARAEYTGSRTQFYTTTGRIADVDHRDGTNRWVTHARSDDNMAAKKRKAESLDRSDDISA